MQSTLYFFVGVWYITGGAGFLLSTFVNSPLQPSSSKDHTMLAMACKGVPVLEASEKKGVIPGISKGVEFPSKW